MSDERRKAFPFHQFEHQWQAYWEEHRTFFTPNPGEAGFDPAKPKYYVLDMFPYPSAEGLHVGHPEGYTATDIIARYQRMKGCHVLHTMGWDAFGLPAEQFAIKTGRHPRKTTEHNINNFRAQLQRLGFSYDWSREVNTTDPDYFKWTQWIFLQLYGSYFDETTQKARPIAELEQQGLSREAIDHQRLAYSSDAPVNWCPALGTVLANEEIEDGKSKTGDHPVERRALRQWMLRITAYAQRLIDELDGLDWPENIKMLQRNWIGVSQGAEVRFAMDGHDEVLTVYTTRPDTLFGATYMVLSPEHPLVARLTTAEQAAAVEDYQRRSAHKSELERTELAKEKSGVFTGAYAINPVNNERIPIWIAEYVLISYGTGAIMAVPAHDQRDWEFARQYHLPIRRVVSSSMQTAEETVDSCLDGEGLAVNSDHLNGLNTAEAKRLMIQWLEEKSLGQGKTNYKLRDWLFSRQRYWGEPFPILWEDGQHRAVSETELPVLPPELENFEPTGTPEPPLSKAKDWVQYSATARREVNTMPQWAGSCWYYLRFCSPQESKRFVKREAEEYWMGGGKPGGVDLYVGGTEHAVLHLLYARFWHKVLHDLGHVSTPEPFEKLVNQGMILGHDGTKMSKSIGNVVNPDEVIEEYGADSLRLYEMFMGPLEQTKPWQMKGVEGVHRFLARVWRLFFELSQEGEWEFSPAVQDIGPDHQINKLLHETIKKTSEDIPRLAFNTALAQFMILTNALTALETRPASVLAGFLKLLSPFAPHLAEECWAALARTCPALTGTGLASEQTWPVFDPEALIETDVEIILQVNGKLRDRIRLPLGLPDADAEAAALANERVQEHTAGKTVRKVVVVSGRLVNIVAA